MAEMVTNAAIEKGNFIECFEHSLISTNLRTKFLFQIFCAVWDGDSFPTILFNFS